MSVDLQVLERTVRRLLLITNPDKPDWKQELKEILSKLTPEEEDVFAPLLEKKIKERNELKKNDGDQSTLQTNNSECPPHIGAVLAKPALSSQSPFSSSTLIPSCSIEITNHIDINFNRNPSGWYEKTHVKELQKSHQGILSLSGPSNMDLIQNTKFYSSTAVLRERLYGNLFSLEYGIKKKSESSLVSIGGVVPYLCPFPEDERLGWSRGSARFICARFDASVQSVDSRGDLDKFFSLSRANRIAVEVDLRSGEKAERTMAFAVDGVPAPAYFTGLPNEVRFAVFICYETTLEFVSFKKGGSSGSIALTGKACEWKD